MKKLLSSLLILSILLCAIPALGQETSLRLTDMCGREVTLDAPAARIVALEPADCEILYAIGAGDALVGRGEYCDYPEEVNALPSVNSGSETNIEQILALEPDVVVMSKMEQTVEQNDALENAGVKVIVTDAQDIQGTYTAIKLLGAVTGHTDEADALVKQMQDAFDSIRSAASETAQSIYFEVSPLAWGLWTTGQNTFMNELATMCGLTNVFADVDGWAEISEEQVIARNPDIIVTITMYYGEGATPDEEIMSRTGWQSLSAVANERVYCIDSNAFSRPGPRLVNAAQTLLAIAQNAYEQDAVAQ